jgi:hypothetical protein
VAPMSDQGHTGWGRTKALESLVQVIFSSFFLPLEIQSRTKGWAADLGSPVVRRRWPLCCHTDTQANSPAEALLTGTSTVSKSEKKGQKGWWPQLSLATAG